MPINAPTLVHDMITRLGVEADTAVTGYDQPLCDLLEKKFEISTPSRDLIREIERRADHEELCHIVETVIKKRWMRLCGGVTVLIF